MKKSLTAFFLTLVIASAQPVHSVIIPDFQVNPTDTAFLAQWETDIAFQKNGNFVVVWEDRGWNHDNRQIYFQLFDSLANPVGSAMLVSDTNTGFYNQECQIATDSASNFAICYESTKDTVGPTGAYIFWDIWVRLYDANGQPITSSIKVDIDLPDPNFAHKESAPHIARHKNGKFVVVWQEEASSETVSRKIFCQFFNSNGERIGNNTWVSNPDSSEIPIYHHSLNTRAAITDNGYVMITWEGIVQGKSVGNPLARIFSIDGISLRKIFPVISPTDSEWVYGGFPDIDGTPSNNFVVTCYANDPSYSYPNNAIIGLRFDTLGYPLNRPVVINDTIDIGDVFTFPRVDAGPEGYIVIWSDARNGKDSRNLMAQRFDYNDQSIGKNYRINSLTGSLLQNYFGYDIDASSQGTVVVSWSDGRNFPTTHYDIYSKGLGFSDIGFYVSGDLNQDGVVSTGDLISFINYLFRRGMTPVPLFQADVNANCKVSVGDLIYLINFLFKQGPSPQQGCA